MLDGRPRLSHPATTGAAQPCEATFNGEWQGRRRLLRLRRPGRLDANLGYPIQGVETSVALSVLATEVGSCLLLWICALRRGDSCRGAFLSSIAFCRRRRFLATEIFGGISENAAYSRGGFDWRERAAL